MKNNRIRLILAAALAIFLLLTATACSGSGSGPTEEDVSDETVFSPPEEDGTMAGIWTTTTDELTIDRYFYGSGQLVTIIQDAEEETWCILSLWTQDGDNISIDNKTEYTYDTSNGEWKEADSATSDVVTSAKMDGDDKFTATETLPNGVSATTEYKRGSAAIEIPDDVGISVEINKFLIH